MSRRHEPCVQKNTAKTRPITLPDHTNMNPDIAGKIASFHGQLQEDKRHRYMSWEHCYSYFRENKIDVDKACLHMAFYLASWGMYRGSSFLLWKDYLIHKEVVEHLITKKHLQNIEFANINDETINEIIDLCAWIRKWYPANAGKINGTNRKINVTDTLVTKIVLGALGCIPAYDRYFIVGLGAHKINPHTPSFAGIKKLVSFYVENISQFDVLSSKINNNRKIIYPPMKLIDMYFWQIGFDEDRK